MTKRTRRPRKTQTTTTRKPKAGHRFLQRIKPISAPEYLHCVVFGPSRSGKTYFASTAADYDVTAPALLLDFEGGTGSATMSPNLSVAPMDTWEDFNEAFDFLNTPDHGFKTLIIDSISELHQHSLLRVVDKEVAEKGRNPTDVQIQDYGKAMIMIRRFLRAILGLKMNVIVTALSKEAKFPREGTVRVPAMFGQMAGEMVGMFPVVGYLTQETMRQGKGKTAHVRRLYLQNEAGMRIGSRVPINADYPNFLEDPKVEDLYTHFYKAFEGAK